MQTEGKGQMERRREKVVMHREDIGNADTPLLCATLICLLIIGILAYFWIWPLLRDLVFEG